MQQTEALLRMIQEIHIVRVLLTDDCPDTMAEILHGEGSSLGPTFDKLQVEAQKCGGTFSDWEPSRCDYEFPTKESAQRFTKSIKKKFKTQVDLEYFNKFENKDGRGMRIFKNLPDTLENRIAALTPRQISGLKVQIRLLEDDCLIEPSEKLKGYETIANTHRMVYANMRCKITNKVRSKPILLRSGAHFALPMMQKTFVTIDDYKRERNRAIESGWSESDLSYDAIINGVMASEVDKACVNGKTVPEILFACDRLMVVIHDYEGSQFVGWVFYNENLDEPLNFTNYKV